MITRHTRGKITWIDLESPTHDELTGIMTEFDIDPRIEDEIIAPTPYPITIAFPNYLYLILHFPTTAVSGGTRNQEIDIIVGKNFLITARYEVIDSIHNLHKVFEAEELLGLPTSGARADALLERVLRRLYGAMSNELEQLARSLERIERDIFSGRERETVYTISETGRILLRFETTLVRHREPLQDFLRVLAAPTFFGKGFAEHAAHIEAERDHTAALVASYRDVASELRATNDSLLSATQNEVMKNLTVVAFVLFPPILIAALFQIGAQDTPLIHEPNGFWFLIALMLMSVVGSFTFSRIKHWL